MKEKGLPAPVFSDARGMFRVVLYNHSEEARKGASGKTKIADEKGLLAFCRTPRTREEILKHIDLASGQYAFRRYLAPLLQAGAIRMTKPEAPRCRDQRYVTAE